MVYRDIWGNLSFRKTDGIVNITCRAKRKTMPFKAGQTEREVMSTAVRVSGKAFGTALVSFGSYETCVLHLLYMYFKVF